MELCLDVYQKFSVIYILKKGTRMQWKVPVVLPTYFKVTLESEQADQAVIYFKIILRVSWMTME